MVCRHSPGDPNCSENKPYYSESFYDRGFNSPDSSKYEIIDVARVGEHLVMKILYPNCSQCSYEGNKVMVFLNVSEFQALKWKKIDPHFRELASDDNQAPSPAARFPASQEGWNDAIMYAQRKMGN